MLDAVRDEPAGRALVVLDSLAPAFGCGDFAGWAQALARLDAGWIAPATAELRAGRVSGLDLVLGGDARTLVVRLVRGDLRRFWRRPQPLARAALA